MLHSAKSDATRRTAGSLLSLLALTEITAHRLLLSQKLQGVLLRGISNVVDDALGAMRGIPALYRMTNRAVHLMRYFARTCVMAVL